MSRRTNRSTTTMVVSVVAALMFLGFAVLLTGSTTTLRATANARTLHWVNATNGSVSALRSSLSQAVLFAYDSLSSRRQGDPPKRSPVC